MAQHTYARMSIGSTLSLAAIGLITASAAAGTSQVLIDDHFDDGTLDLAWEITLECADGFTFEESGTELTVTDFDSVCLDTGFGGLWTKAVFRHSLDRIGDVNLQADFSWDSEETVNAMQQLQFNLLNGNGDIVATAWFSDSHVGLGAKRYAFVASGEFFITQPGEMPFSGSASVEIERTGCDVVIRWDDEELVTGTSASPIEAVTIEFWYYQYANSGLVSLFGTETVDRITVEGSPSVASASDIDLSGVVGFDDLQTLLESWGTCPPAPEPCRADLDGNGAIGMSDLVRVLANWGTGIVCQ